MSHNKDALLHNGIIRLDGRMFPGCSEALDYLLDLWGSTTQQQCREAEEYLGSLYSDAHKVHRG